MHLIDWTATLVEVMVRFGLPIPLLRLTFFCNFQGRLTFFILLFVTTGPHVILSTLVRFLIVFEYAGFRNSNRWSFLLEGSFLAYIFFQPRSFTLHEFNYLWLFLVLVPHFSSFLFLISSSNLQWILSFIQSFMNTFSISKCLFFPQFF